MFLKKKITQYEVLKENEEEIPQHKQIRDFQTRITASEMATGKATTAPAPGPTLPTIDMVVPFLSHFVYQTNNSGHGISGAGRGSGRVRGGLFGRGGGGGRGGSGGGGRTNIAARNYTFIK